MNFSIERSVFLNLLKKVQGITEKNPIIPMSSNVLIESEKKKIIMQATNLEVGIIIEGNANVEKKGKAVLDARKTYEIVREMPEGDVYVSRKETGWMEIKQEKIIFNIAGQSDEEFPQIERGEEVEFLEMEAESVLYLVKNTLYATSDDITRGVLRGVLVEREGGVVRLVATDGHRLAMAEVKAPGGEAKGAVIIPEKGAREIKRLTEETSEKEIKVGFGERSVVVKTPEETLVVRLMEGDFPDYKRVVPKGNKNVLVMRTQDLMETVKRVALLAEDETKIVRFDLKKGRMIVSSSKAGQGEAREEKAVDYEGEEIVFGLNSRYVVDVLNTKGGGDVMIELLDGKTPVLMREKGNEGTIAVIMPMIL